MGMPFGGIRPDAADRHDGNNPSDPFLMPT